MGNIFSLLSFDLRASRTAGGAQAELYGEVLAVEEMERAEPRQSDRHTSVRRATNAELIHGSDTWGAALAFDLIARGCELERLMSLASSVHEWSCPSNSSAIRAHVGQCSSTSFPG